MPADSAPPDAPTLTPRQAAGRANLAKPKSPHGSRAMALDRQGQNASRTIDRETVRAITMARRLGRRLMWVLRDLEMRDPAAAALRAGVIKDIADPLPDDFKVTTHDIGAAGLPDEAWVETWKEYGKILVGLLGERRRLIQTTKGKTTPGDTASDSEAIIDAIMLATPEERAEADRRMRDRAKDGNG